MVTQAQIARKLGVSRPKSIPLVSVGTFCSQATDNVQVDLTAGNQQVMAHLIDSGHRRIAHATFVHKYLAHESRRLGYIQGMKEAGLTPECQPNSNKQADEIS